MEATPDVRDVSVDDDKGGVDTRWYGTVYLSIIWHKIQKMLYQVVVTNADSCTCWMVYSYKGARYYVRDSW